MTSHKQLWRIGKELRADRGIVVAGIATYVLDEHIDILALKAIQLTIHQSQVAPIAIAAYCTERTEGSQFLGHLDTTYIACMPYLIAGFKVVQVLIVPIAVGIAQYAYLLNNPKL